MTITARSVNSPDQDSHPEGNQYIKNGSGDLSSPEIPTDWTHVSDKRIISIFQRMDNYAFEHFVADLWNLQGWETHVSQASNDQGIDVTATKNDPFEQKQLIQVKRYSDGNSVGSTAIQQYASLRHQEQSVDAVVVVTSSSFTKQARELGEKLNVKLVDGTDLVRILRQVNGYPTLDKYVGSTVSEQSNSENELSLGGTPQQQSNQSHQPKRTDHLTDIYISTIASRASGKFVTTDRLQRRSFSEAAPIYHLERGEQPEYLFVFTDCSVPDREDASGSPGFLLITDRGIVLQIAHKSGDQIERLDYGSVSRTEMKTSWTGRRKIFLHTRVGSYSLNLRNSRWRDPEISSKQEFDQEVNNALAFIDEQAFKSLNI